MALNKGDLSKNHLGNIRPTVKGGAIASPANFAIFQTIDTLSTYLQTKGYTEAQLRKMTKNDMSFAATRLISPALTNK